MTFICVTHSLYGAQNYPWSASYQEIVLERFAQKLPKLAVHPALLYPNQRYTDLFTLCSSGKVRIFGYGSLMNKESLLAKNQFGNSTVKMQAVESMYPAVAFGVKRLYNYVEPVNLRPVSHPKEKAMLNLVPSACPASFANGVLMEVDVEDLKNLIHREVGYDLVPILAASWEQLVSENRQIEFVVAYAFMAACELRNRIAYTSSHYLPIKSYLMRVEKGAASFGESFLQMHYKTTYLADGTTLICDWDGYFDKLLK